MNSFFDFSLTSFREDNDPVEEAISMLAAILPAGELAEYRFAGLLLETLADRLSIDSPHLTFCTSLIAALAYKQVSAENVETSCKAKVAEIFAEMKGKYESN